VVDFWKPLVPLFEDEKAKGNPALLGKWQQPDGGWFEFRAGASLTVSNPKGAREVKYRLVDDKAIEISTAEGVPLMHLKIVSLEKDELVIANEEGTRTTLRRVK
jgi:hypothetical protein